MHPDGSCPECGFPHADRADFTYAREGEDLTGLTCLATCRGCGATWVEVYRLERIIRDEASEGATEPAAEPEPEAPAEPAPPPAPPKAGPLKRPRRT